MKKAIIIGLAITAFAALLISKQITNSKKVPEMHVASVEQGSVADSILASVIWYLTPKYSYAQKLLGGLRRYLLKKVKVSPKAIF